MKIRQANTQKAFIIVYAICALVESKYFLGFYGLQRIRVNIVY
jgi:hypothetical protein